MNPKLLLITNEKGFVIDTLCLHLTNVGFDIERAGVNIEDIRQHMDVSKVALVFLGRDAQSNMDVWSFMRDELAGPDRTLAIMGLLDELEAVETVIPQNRMREFKRPYDMRNMAAELYAMDEMGPGFAKKKSLLLVDDDLAYLKMLGGSLQTKYNVSMVKSGLECLEFLEENRPDMILLDYMMPVMSGPDVLDEIRQNPETAVIPVIFLTGRNDRESVVEVLMKKPAGYILKTSSMETILDNLKDWFDQHQETQQ